MVRVTKCGRQKKKTQYVVVCGKKGLTLWKNIHIMREIFVETGGRTRPPAEKTLENPARVPKVQGVKTPNLSGKRTENIYRT